jgi:hypothetical protein
MEPCVCNGRNENAVARKKDENAPSLEDGNECDVSSAKPFTTCATDRASELAAPSGDPRDGLRRDILALERGVENLEPALVAHVVAHHVYMSFSTNAERCGREKLLPALPA